MKINKILTMLFSLAIAIGFVGCSDDDAILPMLDTPEVSLTGSTFKSLSFEWDKVENALQYGYQLVDADEAAVASGVVKKTSVKISGLKADSEYTLRVWPFAGLNVNYSTPPAVEISAKTEPIIKLGTPTVSVAFDGNKTVISWTRVDNAETYAYTLFKDGEQIRKGEPSSLTLTLRNLEEGSYTFNIQAKTTEEGFSNGDIVSETFRIGEEKPDTWTVTGIYQNDFTGDYYDVTLTKNEDGTYTIAKFWGYDGYDLVFDVDDDGYVTFTNAVTEAGYNNYKWIWASEETALWVYVVTGDPDYSPMFNGDESGGDFWFGYYDDNNDWEVDYMSWGDVNSRSSWHDALNKKQGPRR